MPLLQILLKARPQPGETGAQYPLGVGVDAERNEIATVVVHQFFDVLFAVPIGDKIVEFDAIQIRRRSARPSDDTLIDLVHRFEAIVYLQAHQHVVVAALAAADAARAVGFAPGGEPLDQPGGLQGIRKQQDIAAENIPQKAGDACRLVEVQNVRVLVGQQGIEPTAVILQTGNFIGRCHEDGHAVGGKNARVTVGEIHAIGYHDVHRFPRLPVEGRAQLGVDALGRGDGASCHRLFALGIVNTEMRAVQGMPTQRRIVTYASVRRERSQPDINAQQTCKKMSKHGFPLRSYRIFLHAALLPASSPARSVCIISSAGSGAGPCLCTTGAAGRCRATPAATPASGSPNQRCAPVRKLR